MGKKSGYWWLPILLIVCSALANAGKKTETSKPREISSRDIKVVDGDSLFLGRKEVRLSGIDAPEYRQECFNAQGKAYPCGKIAYKKLKELIKGDVRCKVVVRDKYKRYVAVCESGGIDVNKKMVESGWAVAYKRYTQEYEAAEQRAKNEKKGIWQGKFMKPELYRILNKRK